MWQKLHTRKSAPGRSARGPILPKGKRIVKGIFDNPHINNMCIQNMYFDTYTLSYILLITFTFYIYMGNRILICVGLVSPEATQMTSKQWSIVCVRNGSPNRCIVTSGWRWGLMAHQRKECSRQRPACSNLEGDRLAWFEKSRDVKWACEFVKVDFEDHFLQTCAEHGFVKIWVEPAERLALM